MPHSKLSVATLLVALVFAADASANANDVSYKGTKFGSSERTFSEQHRNEGFVCTDAPSSSVGRWCTSEVATYAKAKTATTVQFLDDSLVLVSVFFRDPTDLVSDTLFDANIVSQLERQYGPPSETEWPVEASNGAKTWKKVWHGRNGSSVTYLHVLSEMNGSKLEQRSVFLQSKEADKLLTRASAMYKSDM